MAIANFTPPSIDITGVRSFQQLRDAVMRFLPNLNQYMINYFQLTLLPSLNSALYSYGTDIASAATISPTNFIHQVTGVVTVATINAPTGFAGPLMLYAKDGFAVNTAGNITPAATVVAGHGILLAYHPAVAKWVGVTS